METYDWMGEIKIKWESRFFSKKNLRIQFDVGCYFESNGGVFDSLAQFGGEL